MVSLNRIYTRQGDDGSSGLVTGARRSKADPRFEAIGTVDETNAAIGLARLHAAALGASLDAILGRVQNDLFDLGADLATPDEPKRGPALRVSETQVHRLEGEIDEINAALSPLTSFVLPGGTPGAAALHVARTVCRRAERLMVALRDGGQPVSPAALSYINRLSDLLFVLARAANDGGAADVLWVPGENR
jgi:cob(I)alamin adenosyltransferase